MKSWKVGAIAGLIAGIVAGSIFIFINIPLNFKLGLPYLWYPPPSDTPFMKFAMTEITFNIIWGIVSGIMYSRIYDLIPGRSILKAIIFGLGLYLIVEVRGAFFSIVYGYVQEAITGLVQIWFSARALPSTLTGLEN
jgi:hypothetical protein